MLSRYGKEEKLVFFFDTAVFALLCGFLERLRVSVEDGGRKNLFFFGAGRGSAAVSSVCSFWFLSGAASVFGLPPRFLLGSITLVLAGEEVEDDVVVAEFNDCLIFMSGPLGFL